MRKHFSYKKCVLENSQYPESYMYEIFTNDELIEISKLTEEEFRDNYYFIEKMVRRCSTYLSFASDRLRDDDDLVDIAVSNFCPGVVRYLSPRLADDKEVIRKAIVQSQYNIKYVNEKFKNDIEIAETLDKLGYRYNVIKLRAFT